MAIAYLISREELAVLAFFADEQALVGFDPLPGVDAGRCESVLLGLQEKGMALVSDEGVSLPAPLALIMRVLARPSLSVRAENGVWAHCTADLGVLASRAPHAPHRSRILPLPTAQELAEALWEESGTCFDEADFDVFAENAPAAQVKLTQQALQDLLGGVYLGEAEPDASNVGR